MDRERVTRSILIVLVALAVLTSGHQERLSQKSFVRAVLLQATETGVHVGLLYQDAAPSADASEAGETLKIAAAQGSGLETSFAAAEGLLPQKADYKLCDYVLLCGRPDYSVLAAYAELLLEETEQGRLAAYVYASDGDLSFFEQAAREEESFLSDWMDTFQLRSENGFRLYEISQGTTLLPLLSVEHTDTPYWHSGAWLISKNGCTQKLDENCAQLILLLRDRGEEHRFVLQGETFELIPRAIEKHSDQAGKVSIRIQAQTRHAGSLSRLEAQLQSMAAGLWAVCGEELDVLLGLPGVRAMAEAKNNGETQIVFSLYEVRV